MTKHSFAAAAAALALMAGPALALAGGPPAGKGKPDGTTPTKVVGPKASNHAKGKAYGKYCADASKKKAEGQKRSPFSECVTAMAKLNSGEKKTAKAACKGLSKKKAAGQKKSSYAACISAAAKLKADEPGETPVETTPAPTTPAGTTPAPTTP